MSSSSHNDAQPSPSFNPRRNPPQPPPAPPSSAASQHGRKDLQPSGPEPEPESKSNIRSSSSPPTTSSEIKHPGSEAAYGAGATAQGSDERIMPC
ncbi:hypothetical protein AJ80_01241 [Polytolypa hystricis UAMH7299]|uniref:Uncharacterized protein n=1 Tax=Polytolypa hystricis (strain UAMH7299) TaxID=1447883 RepID=A0A2B7Z0D3_POLH7|nr:hypothetical protein AJ80_01241 [Polytolypa hystricis UAMH7299]